jgi:hypothetical protein
MTLELEKTAGVETPGLGKIEIHKFFNTPFHVILN